MFLQESALTRIEPVTSDLIVGHFTSELKRREMLMEIIASATPSLIVRFRTYYYYQAYFTSNDLTNKLIKYMHTLQARPFTLFKNIFPLLMLNGQIKLPWDLLWFITNVNKCMANTNSTTLYCNLYNITQLASNKLYILLRRSCSLTRY